MRILGVNFGHASAAVYIEDGRIKAAIDEEKLSRVKGESSFPHRAVAFILQKYGLQSADIDIVAVGCEDIAEFSYGYRILNRYFRRTGLPDRFKGIFYDGLKRLLPLSVDLSKPLMRLFYRSMAKMGFPAEKIRLVNHHRAHAASAYYTSPWRDAVIVTNDGKGDGLCGTFYIGKGGILSCMDRVRDLDSIGQFYQSVTRFLGYRVNRHEGKITGLAAFGNSDETFRLMNQIYRFDAGHLKNTFHDIGEFREDPLNYFIEYVNRNDFIHINYIKSLHGTLINFAAAYQMYINFLKDKMEKFEPKEIAAGIQKLAEDAVVAYVKSKLVGNFSSKICLAGGVFANVKINQRVREIAGIENVYVQPAMDDAGTSLGAALAVWMDATSSKEWTPLETVYLGPEYTEQEIEQSLKKYGLTYRKVADYPEVLGKMIHEGKIIGRFNGALEWGPRALGNRSILARPTEKNINDILNKRLRRTEFMPFAPSMLDEDAGVFLMDYSSSHAAAKYMTITYNVRPSLIDRIQAAVHVDGTARPQVVFRKDNPSFYDIIKAYKKLSGTGVVINTSFNMHEEPIVNSPDDAIRSFLDGAVDVLSVGPFIVESNKVSEKRINALGRR